MLIELRVLDLGVIEDLTLAFAPGMTALTGETGAGKTLVVEALNLVLGGRVDASLVRRGATEALVEARFVTGEAAVAQAIGEEPEGGDIEVVLARAVPASGRSRAWINGRMAPAGTLAEAGANLVDIHGQHEHQSLLSSAAQRRVLDAVAGSDLEPRRSAQQRLADIEERLASLGGDERERARRLDVLEHQIAEIEAAGLEDPEEEAALRDEEERLAGLAAIRQAAAEALVLLAGADDSAPGAGAAIDAVGGAVVRLEGAVFEEWRRRLRDVAAELTDVTRDLRQVAETWEDDPERLAWVQERRRQLAELRRKYGTSLVEVMDFAEGARKERADLARAAEEAEALVGQRAVVRAELEAAEAALRRGRQSAAPRLAAAAGSRLADLAMAGARFEIEVADEGAGDGVRFLLGANRGEAVLPLARVASGGELARAMLALRLEAAGGPETMVFDEVDAGVGGQAALALGRALHEVARGDGDRSERQVLVVTHLAQVAAFADHQIAVRKGDQGERTVTKATEVTAEERVVELARMLSGHPDSRAARAHAQELLEGARR